MQRRKSWKMKVMIRIWKITIAFALTTSLVMLLCAGSSDGLTHCFNFNAFSFWRNAQDPKLLCVDKSCSGAPYQLSLSLNEPNLRKDNKSANQKVLSKSPDTKLAPKPLIHLAVVACGDRLIETLVMIKSAIIISQEPIHVHIFADDDLRESFKSRLSKWPAETRKKFVSTIYPITYPRVKNADEWKKLFKPCATQRLFIPYLVPENVTDKVLYVDTDILFMRPLEQIWHFFERFNSSHIAALAPEHEWDRQGWYNRHARHPYYGERGVNSGVMLMQMTKMREMKWIEHMIDYHKEYKFKITWGDQDLINVFFHFYPDKLYVYPCHWNFRPDHCMYGLNCLQAEKRGVSVIHGNRGVYHDEKQPVFRAIYETIQNFKFGDDLTTGLLKPLRNKIDALGESAGYCWRSRAPFTAQLKRQLKLQSQGCKDNPKCDPFEPEDFELEEKLQVWPKKTVEEKKKEKEKVKKVDEKVKKESDEKVKKESVEKVKKESGEKVKKESQNESQKAKQKELFKAGLVKRFPKITEGKLSAVLVEHYTRLQDSRDRNMEERIRPQENVDSALLSDSMHEELLGYAGEFEHLKLNDPDVYLEFLAYVIDGLNPKKETSPEENKPMHLVVVACGDYLEQPLVMMKSAILLARNFLNFHVFAEDELQPKFKAALEAWPENLQNRFKLHIHDIDYPKEHGADWKKLFKKCATQRLFLPNLMPDIDSIIYVDADILFLRPIDDLWAQFKDFNSTHIASLAPEHEDAHVSWYKRFARHPYYPPLGVNSGVMPMNLTRMREAKWLDYIVPYFHKYRYNTTWGDQDLINIFFHFFPEKLHIFPCDWNYRQDHCMYMHVCKRAEEHGVSILHGARQVYLNEKERSFRAIYEAVKEFKFGAGLKNLLKTMKENVAQHGNTNCGKVGFVLTKQFEEQLNKKRQKK